MSASVSSNAKQTAVIIVDPLSTGANLAHTLLQQGKNVVAVWSDKVSETTMKLLMPGLRSDYYAAHRFDYLHPERSIQFLKALPLSYTAILAGSELGVELTDEIAHELGLPGNGTSLTEARRDKYLMGETVREYAERLAAATGEPLIRSVKQLRSEAFHDAETQAFIRNFFSPQAIQAAAEGLGPLPRMIVKPARSSGSDDVFSCMSPCEVEEKMRFILGRPNKLGIMNTCVLLQEHLEGDEYVVDTVSYNGVHKLAGCWRYLKGVANGAHFVYHGMVIVDGHSEIGRKVFEYTKHVLDALNIRNGCGHAEVMLSPTLGPCLVEIGARLHGGEGIFMNVARKCVGYSQVDVAAAFLGSELAFNAIPDLWHVKPGCYGAAIDLISFREGKLVGYNAQASKELLELPSFISFNCMPKIGDVLAKTVDCFTTVGSISLCITPPRHLDFDDPNAASATESAREEIMRAVARIRTLERILFVLEGDPEAENPAMCLPTASGGVESPSASLGVPSVPNSPDENKIQSHIQYCNQVVEPVRIAESCGADRTTGKLAVCNMGVVGTLGGNVTNDFDNSSIQMQGVARQ